LLESELIQDFLCLRRCGTRLLNTYSKDESINGDVLRSRKRNRLLLFTSHRAFCKVLLSAIFNKVPLLFHIVRDKYFRHLNVRTTCLFLVTSFFVPYVFELMSGFKLPLA